MRISGGLSRRNFLKMSGAGLAGASLLGLAGCGEESSQGSSSGGMWKQYKGMTLNFLSENTAPTAALADLNDFNEDDSLPSVPKGLGDFIPTQLAAAGRFDDPDTLYALPYDAPTMIWMYR